MKKILLTGGLGFLGKYFVSTLKDNFQLIKLGKNPSNDLNIDISNSFTISTDLDYVIHNAGKAHVYPKTEQEKEEFFKINVEGTQNLLNSIQKKNIQKFIFISTVSVYGLEEGLEIDENYPLLGNSPYAKSKIQAEKLIENFCKLNSINYLILRLPLIIGKNPLGNLGKMLEGIKTGKYARIAKGEAKKSVVLAEDVALLVKIWLENETYPSGIYNLTDGYHPTFYEIEEKIRTDLNKPKIISIPLFLAKFLGKIGDKISIFPIKTSTINKIIKPFTFSDAKAKKELNWNPKSFFNHQFK